MFENIILNRKFYEAGVARKQAELEAAIENNKRRDLLIVEQRKAEELLNSVKSYREGLNIIKAAVEKENDNFQTRRSEFLNDVITDSVARIFPQMGLTAKVICDFKRKNKTKMLLFDRQGRIHIPNISQGKLMQYLISFAAVAGITKGLGYKSLFVDEAFGAGAEEILPEVGQIVQKQVTEGTQVVLISQHRGLYQDLPRHVISLCTDLQKDCVIVSEQDI